MGQPSYEQNWEVPPDVRRRLEQMCLEYGWTFAEVQTYLYLYAIKQDAQLAEPLHRQRSARRRNPEWFKDHLYFAAE
jgi:hypothetical protein